MQNLIHLTMKLTINGIELNQSWSRVSRVKMYMLYLNFYFLLILTNIQSNQKLIFLKYHKTPSCALRLPD